VGLSIAEELRREEGGPLPRLITVRVRWCSGAQAVAAELLRRFDPGFEPHGFPVAEIMAGFLRRLVREKRPAVIVLDDIGPDAPDLGLIVRALMGPVRFLPEGVDTPPRIWLLLAGATESNATWRRVHRSGVPADHTLLLPPYTEPELEAIVRDRAQRALGRVPPEPWAATVVATVAGTTAARAIERLRRELVEPLAAERGPWSGVPPIARQLSVEPRLLIALEQSTVRGSIPLHDLKERERRLALAEGERPLPSTTFWRRIVRLEAAGFIHRDVRPGGAGGTMSRLELLRPISNGTLATSGNPRAGAPARSVSFGPGAELAGAATPAPAAPDSVGPSAMRPG